MPDHAHLLLTPAPEISVERAVQFVKGGYSYRLRKEENLKIWQESFSSHRIRDWEDFRNHGEYVRLNPVRARLVMDAREYPYSSANPAFGFDSAAQGLKPHCRESA